MIGLAGVRSTRPSSRTTTPSIRASGVRSRRSASMTRTSVTSPSPAMTTQAPPSRYNAGWSVASEPATTTGMPRCAAAAIMVSAASRMRERHILLR